MANTNGDIMTIIYEGVGDIFDSPAQTVVCPVNCVGVMGSGLALAFKHKCPGLYTAYREECKNGLLTVKNTFLYKPEYGPWVLCLPTKDHFRDPSKMEYIQYNLENISRDYEKMGITSLAMTPIGCGLGRLDYHYNVRPLLYQYLDPIDLEVSILMESELYKARNIF